MNENMAYFILPPRMIEYWEHMRELDRILVDLVDLLTLEYCALHHELDPTAAPCIPITLCAPTVTHKKRIEMQIYAQIRETI